MPDSGLFSFAPVKNIVILGSTGSIGRQTLDVVRRAQGRLRVVGLAAHRRSETLLRQAEEFGVKASSVIASSEDAGRLESLAQLPDADIVVIAVSGAAGIPACIAALEAGKDAALATKEVMVAAGKIVMETAHRHGRSIFPIDSEHAASAQCLSGQPRENLTKLWITGSGGPFREWSLSRMQDASVSDALQHPTWPQMGRKITIDSATLMNKGLELIEAQWLFGLTQEQTDLIIHPQSIVHALAEWRDGSFIAQMALPDMRIPIAAALMGAGSLASEQPRLSLSDHPTPLAFEKPDGDRFPCLGLARAAAALGGTAPATLNAANEEAVALFLEGRIRFGGIPAIIDRVLSRHVPEPAPDLSAVLAADRLARLQAKEASHGRAA